MKAMELLKFIERKVFPSIGVAFFTLSVVWMLVESISRQLGHSFEVSEEVILFSLAWAIFLSLAQSGRENFHIDVDLVFRLLPQRVKHVVKSVTLLLSVFYCVIILVSSLKFIPHLYAGRIGSSSSLELPMWLVYCAIPIGAVLLAFYYLENIFGLLKGNEGVSEGKN